MTAPPLPCVWISRPPGRAQALAQALAAAGMQPLLAPAMHIAGVPDAHGTAAYLAAAESYAVSIFTSQEAAARIAARLPHGAPLPALALGAQSAAALHARYRLLAAAEEVGDSAQLLHSAALRQCRGKLAVIGGTDEADTPPSPPLLAALRARGDEVLPVICYRRTAAAADAELSQRGSSGQVHAAVAYSSDSLRHMLHMTAPHNSWLLRLPLFVIHPHIAAAARALGFGEVHCAASDAMADAIRRRLQSN